MPPIRRPPRVVPVGFLGQEPVVLGAALVAAVAVLAFIKLAGEVREGDTDALDTRLLLLLRRPEPPHAPVLPGWVTEVMRDLSALGGGGVVVCVVAAVLGYLALQRRWAALVTTLAASVGGGLLSGALKLVYSRPRPDAILQLSQTASPSFPSGHTIESTVVYLTLGAMIAHLTPTVGGRIYVLAVSMAAAGLVGISRVYLGMHFPTDVLAGWAVGLAWALLCWVVARRVAGRARQAPCRERSGAPAQTE